MTGLHLVHLTIGIAIVTVFAWRVARAVERALSSQVEVTALYWHFVDIVWIFLYPCLYLVSRA
jgi:cytochrome c oxidase subunit 3